MCRRQPEGRQELMAAKAATPDEARELEGRYRLRRQRSWTSGRAGPPMKAAQTRCPQRALQVLSEHRDASTSRSKARCEARRKARQFWWLGGGERMAAA